MTFTLILLGVLGFAVTVFGALDIYRGRIREVPPESGLFSTPEHQNRSFAFTVFGALLTIVSLLVSLAK